ncbi:MAG: 50S ribosomal protein L3 [uncultured bacterium]|nr:MAG: 50S ribosomal protein L3 [uncultured bacterium]
MKFILGKKIAMTQVFLPSGEVMPVTRVVAGPCTVVQVKEKQAVQLGFGDKKEFRLNKPDAGHLKGLTPVAHLKEFQVEKTDGIKRGDVVALETFVVGDVISVTGVSKGKGFAGVVKRHHFRGGPASHGHKDNLRAPGSIGAGGVQRVFKGMRMAGRMGGDQVTIHNLEVVEVHPETNEIYIKGAVPGGRNGLLEIVGEGELLMKKTEIKNEIKQEQAPEVAPVEVPVETPVVAPIEEAAAEVVTETTNS